MYYCDDCDSKKEMKEQRLKANLKGVEYSVKGYKCENCGNEVITDGTFKKLEKSLTI